MKIVLTGADGFLGWHTRVRLSALTDHDVVPMTRANWGSLAEAVSECDAVVHVAGVNDFTLLGEVGNIELANDVAAAVRAAERPVRVVYSNTIHHTVDSYYGRGKSRAAEILRAAAEDSGAHLVDVVLPHLFGEHGRPRYNSFVATFCDAVVRREAVVIVDKPIRILHAQDAAQCLIDGLDSTDKLVEVPGEPTSVQWVYDRFVEFHRTYLTAEIPALPSALEVNLFNMLRTAMFPQHYPIGLTAHEDPRGRLVETARWCGGEGQTFVSTTRPGVTRGEHHHLAKIERFVVMSGQARIALRRMFHDEVVAFDVTGEVPVVVDMPTMWLHNITNMGDTELVTQFWTNVRFDPQSPDTFWEPVGNPTS